MRWAQPCLTHSCMLLQVWYTGYNTSFFQTGTQIPNAKRKREPRPYKTPHDPPSTNLGYHFQPKAPYTKGLPTGTGLERNARSINPDSAPRES
jgi:hypothetical protein